jgi:hypothetical protein
MDLYKVRWQPKEFAPWEIRPWKSGVFASSKTRDGTVEALVYCFADKRPHFQITALDSKKAVEGPVAETHFLVLGQAVDGTAADVTTNNGSVMLQFNLETFDPRTITDSDQIFKWDDFVNSISDYFAYRPLSMVGARENITAALTHCAS